MKANNPGWQKGEKNGGWKGGNGRTGRDGEKYKTWRKAVMERDAYTCQECGKRSRRLHAHHIKEFAKYPELRYDVNNGKAVCVDCHRKIHGFYIPENFFEIKR